MVVQFKNKSLMLMAGILFLAVTMSPATLWADEEVEALKQQLKQLTDMMQTIQKKLETIEQKNEKKDAQIDEIDDRLNKAELHTATDKISLGIELRSRADSIHYEKVRTAPQMGMNRFFTPYTGPDGPGFNGATAEHIQSVLNGMIAAGTMPPPDKSDLDNDVIYTHRFRLNMKAKVNSQLDFAGRLSVYKVFGDSSGVKFNSGNLGDITLDGNTASLPSGDTVHLERAYFNYKNAIANVPINISVGRRPSTEGPPLEYGNFSLEGGSPLAHIINWQFDGVSVNFGLEEVTEIPGLGLKLCYGSGFESDWGNSFSLTSVSDIDDVHLFGFILTLFDNETSSAVVNYAHASDITDGFAGLTVMPFIVDNSNGVYTFTPNTGGFISRTEPATNLGDWDAATLLLRTNLMERFDKDIDLFLSLAWSHTNPDKISEIPIYNLLGFGLLNSRGQLKSQDGYSIYAGARFPMPFDAKMGIEYNWGSQYWFNFTGAEDTLVGSKLAARGEVWEAYYIQPIFEENFFVKLGGQYYDYEYTGSGNPLGKPVKISETIGLDCLFPVVDELWNLYLSANLRF